MNSVVFFSAIVVFVFNICNAAAPPYGQLSVSGTQLKGSNGVVQLRGMSLFWSLWMSKYWNQETLQVGHLYSLTAGTKRMSLQFFRGGESIFVFLFLYSYS